MARVYERPRYINQARNRLLSLAVASKDMALRLSIATGIGVNPATKEAMYADYESLAEAALDGELDSIEDINIDSQVSDYLLDAEIGRAVAGHVLSQQDAARKLCLDFEHVRKKNRPRAVLADERAMFYLLHLAMEDRTLRVEDKVSKASRMAAYNLLHHQLLSQKISPRQFSDAYSRTPMIGASLPRIINADAWLQAVENLQYRSQPMWVKYCRLWCNPPRRLKQRVVDMINKVDSSSPADRHRFYPLDGMGFEYSAYNYAGIIVVYMDSKMFILDNSLCDYLRTAVTALRNARLAFSMMRIAGDTDKHDYTVDFERCVSWISSAIANPDSARHVARHMHLAYTAWQNEVCEGDAEVDCGYAERIKPLLDDMLSYYPKNSSWRDLVRSIQCPERVRAEFLKLYHLLPPPDIDPLLLHETLEERTQGANVASPTAVQQFIKFSSAYDFCRFLAKFKRCPSHRADVDYKFEDTKWYSSCIRGKLVMPPRADWGKVSINKEFAYLNSGDFHVLDAKDSTRVVSDLSKYMDRSKSRDMMRKDQNELLSALFNGELLSNGMSMKEWRAHVMDPSTVITSGSIAAEAGKAENTKPGAKVRETLSACDTVREYLTEVDHSIRPLAEMTPGVSIRVNLVKHKKKFQTMAKATSKSSNRHAFATSTDISGWSPKMDRKMFHAWQEYALSTTECENPIAQVKLWDSLQVFVDRRGVKKVFACDKGNIQGWPATSDTTMHAHILIQWAYELRERKILSSKEAAYTLCLIDDATTVVALEGSVDDCIRKAREARELLKKMYLDLGFIMDEVKSFFSSIKFTYLNELYIDGAQVGHGTKTLMRIDKDHTRRFASITDNIATAFTTAASAASQGADPFTAYWMAANLAFRWVFSRDHRFNDISPLELSIFALAPVSLNGLGIRPITSVFASGENDHLTWFMEVAGTVVNTVGSTVSKNTLSYFLCQELKAPTAASTFKTPFAISAQAHSTATAAVANAFRTAARSTGLADPFKSLDEMEEDPEYEVVLESVLKQGHHEAALLEEVSGNMPEALVDQLLARVDKTEIIAYLLGGRGIGDLRRRTQFCDKLNLNTAYDLLASAKGIKPHIDFAAMIESEGSYATAKHMRNQMYAESEFTVLNHTYPCPFSLWAFDGDIDLDTDRARRLTTLSFLPSRLRLTAGSTTRNMYDSAVEGIGYRGYMTARSDAGREARVALHDPVRRMVAAGLAAFRWASSMGAHHRSLLKLFLKSWSGNIDQRMVNLPGRTLVGTSKRLSLRHSKASHLVYPFQNVQSAVRVDARAITVAQSNTSHMYDVMGAITTLRIAGLLEASLGYRSQASGFAYGFTYHQKSAAVISNPLFLESELPDSAFSNIKSFVDIQSPLAASARVVMSYDGMSHVLQTYIASGEKAARSLFQSMVSNEEITADMAQNHVQQVMEVSAPVPTPVKQAHAWATHRRDRSDRSAGAVSVSVGRSGSSASVEVPRGSLSDQLRHIASSWSDSAVLDLTIKDALFMTQLMQLSVKHRSAECVNIDDWESKHRLLVPDDRALRGIIHEVSVLVPEKDMLDALATVFRGYGASGFRHREGNVGGDLLHMSKSFLRTTSSLIGIASRLGAAMNKLRHSDATGYSRIITTAGSANKRTIARVIRAQWLAAAARRQLKAAEIVTKDRDGTAATKPNYEAVFLRTAAASLSSSGSIDVTSFSRQCVTRVIQSITNHLSEGHNAELFDERLEAAEMDYEGMVSGDSTAEVAIAAVCNIAESIDSSIDTNSIVSSYRMVVGWVRSDVGGSHMSTPVAQRNVNMFLSTLSTSRASMQTVQEVQTRPQQIPMSVPKIGDDSDDEVPIEEQPAEDAFYWFVQQDGAKDICESHFGRGTIHRWYELITKDEDTYKSMIAAFVQLLGNKKYEEQQYSPFAPPSWDDDDAGFVVD